MTSATASRTVSGDSWNGIPGSSKSGLPRLPKPPGAVGRLLGQTQFPPPPLQGPVDVAVHRRAPDRAGVLAHELANAATGLAGKSGERVPGLVPSYLGHTKLFHEFGPAGVEDKLFPLLFARPGWVQVVDQQQALRALQEWFAPKAAGFGR